MDRKRCFVVIVPSPKEEKMVPDRKKEKTQSDWGKRKNNPPPLA